MLRRLLYGLLALAFAVSPAASQVIPGTVYGTAVLEAASYDPAALALFSAMTNKPTAIRRAQINTLISCEKSVGAWAVLDRQWVFAAADSQAAVLDWVTAANPATPTNSPTFNPDRGFTSDGLTSYVSTGRNPSPTTGRNYTQNAASFGVWTRGTNTGGTMMGQTAAGGSVIGGSNGTLLSFRVNDATSFQISTAAVAGLYTVNRAGSGTTGASVQAYVNGVSKAISGGASSSAVVSNFFDVGRGNTGPSYTTNEIAFAYIGGNMTAQIHSDFYNCVAAYMTSIGA